MANGAHVNISITVKTFEGADRPLFSALELDIAPSQIIALVGPSGVGKSTLLRMIAGIDNAYDGTIKIDGAAPHEAPTPGFVFQDPRLLPWQNAQDNICAVNPQLQVTEAARLLSEVGLGGSELALPHQLSGGMQRRVALARALSLSPKILLLDEPFVSLDKKLTHELHKLFLQIVKSYAPTVFLVSHDIEDAAQLADRIIMLTGKPVRIAADYHVAGKPGQRTQQDLTKVITALKDVENGLD